MQRGVGDERGLRVRVIAGADERVQRLLADVPRVARAHDVVAARVHDLDAGVGQQLHEPAGQTGAG